MDTWVHFSGLAVANGNIYAVDYNSQIYCFGLKNKVSGVALFWNASGGVVYRELERSYGTKEVSKPACRDIPSSNQEGSIEYSEQDLLSCRRVQVSWQHLQSPKDTHRSALATVDDFKS